MLVYLITNILNGKCYVGQTTRTLEQRVKEHQLQHSDVGNAINQCGIENFSFEVLDTCDSIEQLNEREMFWIRKLNCITPNGYNRNEGGRNFIRQRHDKTTATVSLDGTMTIGESLKRFRKKFGLSQKDIADVLEIKQPSYAPYETRDVAPSANVIIKLAKAYNVSSDYLLGLVDDPNPYKIQEAQNVDKVTIEDTDALTLAAENDRIMDYHDALANVLAKQGIKI